MMWDGEIKDSTAMLVSFFGFINYPVQPYDHPPLRCFKCKR